jgi:hypothetical protein
MPTGTFYPGYRVLILPGDIERVPRRRRYRANANQTWVPFTVLSSELLPARPNQLVLLKRRTKTHKDTGLSR